MEAKLAQKVLRRSVEHTDEIWQSGVDYTGGPKDEHL
jgi:hypothetical protein